jgi:hypothetical protein
MTTEISDLQVLYFADINTIKSESFENVRKLFPGLTINIKTNTWDYGKYSGTIGHGKKDENRWGIVGFYNLRNSYDVHNLLHDIEHYSNSKTEQNHHDF